MVDQQPVQLNLDANMYAMTGVNIVFDEEHFVFGITSGNQIRQFLSSPKHAKRILLLLQKQIDAYESTHGKLETQLPEIKTETPRVLAGFQDPDLQK